MSKQPSSIVLATAVVLLAAGGLSAESHAQPPTLAASPDSAAVAIDAPRPLSAEELEALVAGVTIDPDEELLSAAEMEVLVARIALYPDELIAVIVAASLYPLQIVEAQRFLDDSRTNKVLKPKSSWDGSVVSLLNYPEIVRMMSDDLDWTQRLGEAIANQEQDVLAAIQQLREKAVAQGIIKTDDKVKVVEENNDIVIHPASAEVIYVPQYAPEMLYEEDYIYRHIAYYPDPYPYYYSPIAPFFAGLVTGVIWFGIVDWDDGCWGGNWGNDWGDNIYIDCNNCFNNGDFNGKLDINNVDWSKIDRSKIKFDTSQLSRIDRERVKNSIKYNDRNRISSKARDLTGSQASTLPSKVTKSERDVRTRTLEGLKKQSGRKPSNKEASPRPGVGKKLAKPEIGSADKRLQRGKIDRRLDKPKLGATKTTRRKNTSDSGEVKRGKAAKTQSNRGAKSMKGNGYTKPTGGGGSKNIRKQRIPKVDGQRGSGRRCTLPECQP